MDLQVHQSLMVLESLILHYNISKEVANGSASSPIINGSRIANPTLHVIVPRITTRKIYKRSFGHTGSP